MGSTIDKGRRDSKPIPQVEMTKAALVETPCLSSFSLEIELEEEWFGA